MPDGDILLHNARLWQCTGDSVLLRHGVVVATGHRSDVARQAEAGVDQVDVAGRLLTPGLIDCHTHLVHGGSRADEFALRLQGATYEEIARRGGGIMSTVRATRQASFEELLHAALDRIDALQRDGVTTVEIKSGYGLDLDTERKMLRVARAIDAHRNISVSTTFLGAHALPPEFDAADDYIAYLCDVALPALHGEGLIDAVDAFCERIAFSPRQVERLFDVATRLGLRVKLHAEQLSDQGGARLAARFRALSADHLEWLSDDGIAAMADAGVVAVMLPGAFYAMRETRTPPITALRAAGVKMAVATDLNPGTSPVPSLLMVMNQAAILFGMTTAEIIDGVTRHAAHALGMGDRGAIRPGAVADLVIWNTSDPADLLFGTAGAKVWRTMAKGKWIG